MKQITFILTILLSLNALPQKKKKEDLASILSMCGCHEISFNFAETFASSVDYQFHENYTSKGLEWVFPIEQTKDKVVLQHLLIVNEDMIIKHWRQDWIYENQDQHNYLVNNTWRYHRLSADQVRGQWTQKVYQVDDSPRYEGTGTWVHVDGRSYWEATGDSPLPRREFSKRDDYNLMVRTNRHEITSYGWLHEQDNDKVIRTEEGDQKIASEKGWNTYTKVDETKCLPAQNWWKEQSTYWTDVRIVWDGIFATKEDLSLSIRKDDQILFQRLFALGNELSDNEQYNSAEAISKISEIIEEHRKHPELLADASQE